MLTMKADFGPIRRALAGMPLEIRKASITALRETVKYGTTSDGTLTKELSQEMNAKIDRPTPYTNRGGQEFYVQVPERDNESSLVATVGLRKHQAAYLQFLIKGIARDNKIIERRMPGGPLLVPSRAVKLDRYGNVPKAQFLRIVRDAQSGANDTFYLPTPKGKMRGGIYQRTGNGGARPLFFAVDRASYKQQFDFYAAAQAGILKRLGPEMEKAIAYRLKRIQQKGIGE